MRVLVEIRQNSSKHSSSAAESVSSLEDADFFGHLCMQTDDTTRDAVHRS